MIFTSFILFFGFIIFAFSNFGGIIVLGVLKRVLPVEKGIDVIFRKAGLNRVAGCQIGPKL